MYRQLAQFSLVTLLFGWQPSSADAQQTSAHHLGFFKYYPSSNGIVIAAPHGRYDKNTDGIAIAISRILKSGYVIARGFSIGKPRINVNRPTESYPRSNGSEFLTSRSAKAYSQYVGILRELGGGNHLKLYVEIHGHSSRLANTIEIASVGLSADRAFDVKRIFTCVLRETKMMHRGYPNVDLKIEPADFLSYRAIKSKQIGSLSANIADLALHVELPLVLRQDQSIEATAQLIAFLITSNAMKGVDPIDSPSLQWNYSRCDSFRS